MFQSVVQFKVAVIGLLISTVGILAATMVYIRRCALGLLLPALWLLTSNLKPAMLAALQARVKQSASKLCDYCCQRVRSRAGVTWWPEHGPTFQLAALYRVEVTGLLISIAGVLAATMVNIRQCAMALRLPTR